MEDALVPIVARDKSPVTSCLNPCFNGRCTRTYQNIPFGRYG